LRISLLPFARVARPVEEKGFYLQFACVGLSATSLPPVWVLVLTATDADSLNTSEK
jgi:hypothetical protein